MYSVLQVFYDMQGFTKHSEIKPEGNKSPQQM